MPATVNIQSTTTFVTPFGSLAVGPIPVTGTIVPLPLTLLLQSGNNSFTCPTGAVGCIVTPPTTNAIVLKAKTTSGDTGMNRPAATPWIEIFDPANLPTTYFINAASLTVGNTTVLFF